MPGRDFHTELEQWLRARPLLESVLKYEILLSLLAFALLWGGLLICSGTLTSGYHLIDDWELLMMSDSLNHSGLLSVTADNVQTDLKIRLRPWFYIQRIFTLWLLGFNMTLLSIQLLVTAVFSSVLLYMFARTVGFGAINSLLFVFLSFLGHQTAIWWRLGAAEPVGIFWFALGLLFMAKAVVTGNRRTLYTVLSVIGFILATLAKESFVVLMPVVSLAWLMLYYRNNEGGILDTARAGAMPVLSLILICVAELALIFRTAGIGYAGVDSQSLAIPALYGTLKNLVSAGNRNWIIILLAVLGIALLVSFRKRPQLSLLVELACVALVILLFSGSQVLLYAKSGINERYLVPATLSLAFLIVYLIAKIEQLIRPYSLRLGISVLLLFGTLGSLSLQAATAWTDAKRYAEESPPLHRALEELNASTQNRDVVVLVADPARDYEASIAIREYLRVLFNRTNVFVYPLWANPADSYSAFEKELGKSYEKDLDGVHFDRLADKSQVRAIFTCTLASTDDAFRRNTPDWFHPAEFKRTEFGAFVVYSSH